MGPDEYRARLGKLLDDNKDIRLALVVAVDPESGYHIVASETQCLTCILMQTIQMMLSSQVLHNPVAHLGEDKVDLNDITIPGKPS